MGLGALRNPLSWILLGALALRLGTAVWLQHDLDVNKKRTFLISGDAEGYWELGRRIARGETYQLYGTRQVERMPGYPAFVAGSIRLAEAIGAPQAQYFTARLLMAVVGTLACGLVAWLGCQMFDARIGNIAAALAAVSPALIGFSAILLSETLFAVALLLSLCCLAALVREMRVQTLSDASGAASSRGPVSCLLCWASVAGAAIGAAVYVRPSWLVAAPIFGLLVAGWLARHRHAGLGVGLAAALMLTAYGVLIPWAYRNHRVTGHWVFTTLWVGPSLYDGFNPQATGDSNLKFVDDDRLSDRMSEYEVDRYYHDKAWTFVRENPQRALTLTLNKIARYWSPWPNAAQFDQPLLKLALSVSFIFLVIAAGIGWWTGPKTYWGWALTLGPIFYFAAIHAVFLGSLRYRLPAEYPLCVAAAVGLNTIWTWSTGARSLETAPPPASA